MTNPTTTIFCRKYNYLNLHFHLNLLYTNNISILKWPAFPSDLNIVKNVLNVLLKLFYKDHCQIYRNISQQANLLKSSWCGIEFMFF